ncbi:MAG: hypothetical protein ACI8TX_001420 [Hyphomicrobiaceae bacterium]|jgi:hypothetical protein
MGRTSDQRVYQPGLAGFAAALLVSAAAFVADAADPWGDRLRSFTPGATAGFGAADLPDIVLGPPEGAGENEGSFHVVSLGSGGGIEVVFTNNVVEDGPGDDLVVFENAFRVSDDGAVFDELAWVEVSRDGREYFRFPFDVETGDGLAGRAPVLANSSNELDPLDPLSGGDRFDLADVGLDYVRYVRIVDGGDTLADFGNLAFPGTKGGFDLDAIGAVNSLRTVRVRGKVSAQGVPIQGLRVVLRGTSDGRKRWRRTNAQGCFRFARLIPDGEVIVRAFGRELGRSREVRALSSAQSRVDLEMELE